MSMLNLLIYCRTSQSLDMLVSLTNVKDDNIPGSISEILSSRPSLWKGSATPEPLWQTLKCRALNGWEGCFHVSAKW